MAEKSMELIEEDRLHFGMKGTNTRRGRVDDDGQRLHIANVFWTIQGEGPFSGHRAMFIRLTGCNLACQFCDTYWGDEKDPYMTLDEIVERVKGLCVDVPLFVLTGGEPARQNIDPLIWKLFEVWPLCEIQIETAGSFFRKSMRLEGVHTVVSPKMRSISKEVLNLAPLGRLYFKYVVKATDGVTDSGVPVTDTQGFGKVHPLASPPFGVPVYVTPCEENDPDVDRANMRHVAAIAMRFGYTAQLQIHKLLGVE